MPQLKKHPKRAEQLQQVIASSIEEGIRTVSSLRSSKTQEFISDVAYLLAQTFSAGHKVLIAGNGGSLCDAMHFAEELTGYFRTPRKALPAIVLSEAGHLTCVANDAGFETVFARGVEALGTKGDVFIALSTSGNSKNLVLAVQEAKRRQLHTVCFLGKGGGALCNRADFELIIANCQTSDHIQEAHMTCLHTIIEAVEAMLFAKGIQKKGKPKRKSG